MRASEIISGVSFICPERSASLNQIQLTPSVVANCSSEPALQSFNIRFRASRSRADVLPVPMCAGSIGALVNVDLGSIDQQGIELAVILGGSDRGRSSVEVPRFALEEVLIRTVPQWFEPAIRR